MATALSPEDVESRLRARFGQDILAFEVQHGHAVATVSTERYRDVCRFLRDEPEFDCTYCDFTAGVDFGPERGFEVVTHLFSVALLLRLRSTGLPVCYRGRKAAREAWRLNLMILVAAAICMGLIVAVFLLRR